MPQELRVDSVSDISLFLSSVWVFAWMYFCALSVYLVDLLQLELPVIVSCYVSDGNQT